MAKKGGACSNGIRIPYTPIAVDYFHRPSLPARTLFFLTHSHADHLYGLDSSFDQTIYCTSLTKQLVLLHISIDPDLLVELEFDEPRQLQVDCPGNVFISVTTIDSCHCPGSAMFLFEGYFGTILHTGDFRLSPKLLAHPLLKNLEPDVLYLDNTYNDPIFDFPERSVTCDKVVKLVKDNPHLRTFIAFNKLGKEDLLVNIVRSTDYAIGVSLEQYKKMEILGLHYVCSLDSDQCQVIVVPFYAVTEANVNRWINECPTQVIIPTSRFEGSEHPLKAYPCVHIVQYSDHCSYKELYQFVELVKPVSIHPVVQRDKVSNMSCFEHLRSSRKITAYEIPKGIKSLLYSRTDGIFRHSPSNSGSKPSSRKSLKLPKGVRYLSPKKPEVTIISDTTKPHDHLFPHHPTTPVAINTASVPLTTNTVPLTTNTVDATQTLSPAGLPVRDFCTCSEPFPKRVKTTLSPINAATIADAIDNVSHLIEEEKASDIEHAAPKRGEGNTAKLPLLNSHSFDTTDGLLSWIKMVGEQMYYDQQLYSKDNPDFT